MNRKAMQRDAADEIQSHLEEKIDELERSGLSPEAAREQAHREFGNSAILIEDSRAVWRSGLAEQIQQDLRLAARQMRRSPGFTAIAVVSLALGIGANTAVFSVVKALLLDPLPYRDPTRLTLLWTEDAKRDIHEEGTGYLTFEDWKQRSRSFEDIAICSRGNPVFLSGIDPPQQIPSEVVSANMFPLLGAQPLLGRTFTAEEEAKRNRVVVLSFGLWRSMFGGSSDAIGKHIEIDGEPHEVIGVMPRDFFFPDQTAQLWRPSTLERNWDRQRIRRYTDWWRVAGRLKPGVSVAQAQVEMNRIGEQLEREYHSSDADFAGFGVNVVPMLLQVVGKKTPLLLEVLLVSVIVLLLIACSNLGHLLLARGVARQHEFGVRRALGASRGRLVRQVLTESVLLTAAASVIGVGLAFLALRAVLTLAPAGIPRLHEIRIDTGVLLFAAAVSLIAPLLLGVVPALQLSGTDPSASLRENDRQASASRARARARDILVAAEFALGCVLLFAAALLVRSYVRVQSADVGFRADHVFTARISRQSSTQDFYPRLLERLKALPGVIDAGAVDRFFIDWNPDSVVTAEEQQAAAASESEEQMAAQAVSPGYFRAMNMQLLKGRIPAATEPNVAVIDSEMAQRYWPGKDPIGKRFKHGRRDSRSPWITVTGVVAGTRRQGREVAPIPEYYRMEQHWGATEDVVIRTSSNPLQLAAAFRAEVHVLDRTAAVSRVTTVEQHLDELLAPRRFETLLLTLFSVLATILAAIGIYGATYYAVSQRVQEIGIRIALGARATSVIAMLLGQTSRLALIGIAIGLAASLSFGQWLASLLYEIAPTDPLTLTLVPVVLISVALTAALLPARRATTIDPSTALRYE